MSFADAVRSCLNQYVGFTGRARRSEYWFFVLFTFLVGLVVGIVDLVIGNQILGYLVQLAFLLPGIAVGARRLHDTGKTGWWLLIALVPLIGAIVLIVFFVQDSQPDNEHGPSPKQVPGGYGQGGYGQGGYGQGGYGQGGYGQPGY